MSTWKNLGRLGQRQLSSNKGVSVQPASQPKPSQPKDSRPSTNQEKQHHHRNNKNLSGSSRPAVDKNSNTRTQSSKAVLKIGFLMIN